MVFITINVSAHIQCTLNHFKKKIIIKKLTRRVFEKKTILLNIFFSLKNPIEIQ